MARTFVDNLKVGKVAEHGIAQWLMSRGHAVLPAYETFENDYKGPRLFAASDLVVVPDLLCFIGSGASLWIESKNKSAFSWYRKKKVWTTGIDLHHYNDYLRVEAMTGIPVWLFFVQNGGAAKDSLPSPAGLYAAPLSRLATMEDHRSDRHGYRGMVYWTIDDMGGPLRRIATLEEIEEAKHR